MKLLPIDPPIRIHVPCRHCGEPIQAVAEVHRPEELSMRGLREYEWRHAETGERQCRIVRHAGPYDGWQATALVEAAQQARMVAEDALLEEEQ